MTEQQILSPDRQNPTTESVLEWDKWDNYVYENYALKIKDVLTLKPDQQLKVLCMDRNVWDGALCSENRGKPMGPENFFKNNWAIYVHEENLQGKCLLFQFELNNKTNIDNPLDINSILQEKICQPNFEFHIEYKKHYWYPLTKGYLPSKDPQGIFVLSDDPNTTSVPNQKKHWTSFPVTTNVGYRGYFVPWEKIKELPKIMWSFDDEILNEFENKNDCTDKRKFQIDTNSPDIISLFSRHKCEIDKSTDLKLYTPEFKCVKYLEKGEDVVFDLPLVYTFTSEKNTVKFFLQDVQFLMKKYNVKPLSFEIDIVEITPNSLGNKNKYSAKITNKKIYHNLVCQTM